VTRRAAGRILGRNGGGSKALQSWRYGRVRDGALTALAVALSKTTHPLWYAESLVHAARYQQLLASATWATDSVRCRDRLVLWETLAEPRLRAVTATALEFGVADGLATRWWAARGITFAVWHGFDTFEGLPTAWDRGGVQVMAAGVFTPSAGAGSVPQVTAPFPFTWHRGRIEQTLPALERPAGKVFVLIDVDLLDPATAILDWLIAEGRPGDLVYFDEANDPFNEGLALRRSIDAGLALHALGHTGSALLAELL
jgi:hypothetical protein